MAKKKQQKTDLSIFPDDNTYAKLEEYSTKLCKYRIYPTYLDNSMHQDRMLIKIQFDHGLHCFLITT